MKKMFLLFAFIISGIFSYSQKKTTIPKHAIKGDFNGDGKLDYMWLQTPKLTANEMDCIGECNSFIKFSDPTIPSIKVTNCISGRPSNAGDLNKNRTDEIGLLPGWFTSCWRDYYVWTFREWGLDKGGRALFNSLQSVARWH